MREYEHHQDHSHESHQQKDRSAAQRAHDAWDKVLYGIGSVYFKLTGNDK